MSRTHTDPWSEEGLHSRTVRFGPFELDGPRRELCRAGEPVALAPTLHRLLVALLRRGGRAASRQELLEEVWPDVHVSENALGTAVRRLRRVLEDADPSRAWIETVRGYGFRFGGEIEASGPNDAPTRLAPPTPSGLGAEANYALLGIADPSQEILEIVSSLTEEGIWCYEVDPPVPSGLDPEETIALTLERARLIVCNDVLARTYGYARSEELIGSAIPDLLPPDVPHNVRYLRALQRSRLHLRGALSLDATREGHRRWIRNNVMGLAPAGRLQRIWGTQRELTGPPETAVAAARLPEPPRTADPRRRELKRILSALRHSTDQALGLLDD